MIKLNKINNKPLKISVIVNGETEFSGHEDLGYAFALCIRKGYSVEYALDVVNYISLIRLNERFDEVPVHQIVDYVAKDLYELLDLHMEGHDMQTMIMDTLTDSGDGF